jgi:hypothetical protein
MNTTTAKLPSATAARTARRVYLWVAAVAALLAIIGFWRSYFGPLLAGTVDESLLIHVHGAICTGWFALFAYQAYLASTGRLALHVSLGRWIIAYALAIIVSGVMVAFATAGADVAAGEVARGQRRLFGFLREVIFFTAFVWAGWAYRRSPEVHKRLMVVATTLLVVPAVGRLLLQLRGGTPPLLDWMLVWPVPIYLAMLHDFVGKRLIHPAYVIGWFALLAERLVLPLRESDWWMALSARLFVPFYQSP